MRLDVVLQVLYMYKYKKASVGPLNQFLASNFWFMAVAENGDQNLISSHSLSYCRSSLQVRAVEYKPFYKDF